MKKITEISAGLDIDGVLANFSQAIIDKACTMGIGHCFPKDWTCVNKWMFSDNFFDVWKVIEYDEDFWLNIPAFSAAQEAFQVQPFTPKLYLTHRPVSCEVTAEWLKRNNFPEAPVYTVAQVEEKAKILKDFGHVDIYVDDRVDTTRALRDCGVNAVLYKAPYQVAEDTNGLNIIESLTEIPKYV